MQAERIKWWADYFTSYGYDCILPEQVERLVKEVQNIDQINILQRLTMHKEQHLALYEQLKKIKQYAMAEMQKIRAEECDEILSSLSAMSLDKKQTKEKLNAKG